MVYLSLVLKGTTMDTYNISMVNLGNTILPYRMRDRDRS